MSEVLLPDIEAEWKKPPVTDGVLRLVPRRVRCGPRQEGMLWQRRMRTLALRLPKGKVRRDRSGAPRKRG